MVLKKNWALLCFQTILFVNQSAFCQDYFFGTPIIKNYSTEEFNGGIQSWQITQDKSGIIYIANNFGLLEFDGTTWSIYPVRNTKIRSILIGNQDRVYVGSQANFGYFHPDRRGMLRYVSLADSLPEEYRNFDEVWRIYEADGRVYFLTFKNIFCYTPGKKITIIEPKNPLEFSFQVNNKIYSLEAGVGLSVVENNQLRLLPGGDFFADIQIASILPYDADQLLVFTIRDGLFVYNGAEVTPFLLDIQPIQDHLVINQAIMLNNGFFAVGTQNNGLVIINREGKVALHLSRDKGLTDQTVHTLFQDAHENLWLGLNNGIAMVELSSPFSLIDETMGLSGTGYAALQSDGVMYLGTNNGLYAMDIKESENVFKLIPNSTGQVYQLNQINEHILVGHHNGPFLVREGKVELIYEENGAWEFIGAPPNNQKIIMGSYNGLSLLSSRKGDIGLVKKFKGFDESSRVLEFDNEGNLWMAHGYKGIFKISFENDFNDIEKIDFYNSADGFPSDQLINMEKIHNQLIFPALYGIYRYEEDSDRFVRDKALSDLFNGDEHIVEIEEDVLGNAYFISNQRVGKVSFEKFDSAVVDARLFNKIKDMLNDDLGTIRVLDSKNVLFGAKEGFVHFNSTKSKKLVSFYTHLTKVINTAEEVDSILYQGKRIFSAPETVLPYTLNALRFVYSSSFFESPEKTEYQFRLKNFDSGWSEWTNKTEKEYTNLPEGQYEFCVRARNVYGTVSESEAFTFVVEPPFYRSRMAYIFYTLSGLLLFSITFFQIDKRFKKEKKLIMLKQERELFKKDFQIERITTQSEQEIVKLRNEKLRSEIDHMNRELTSSTIHLLNKNELLNSVKLDLGEIIRKKEKVAHDELKKIIKNIDQNITSDGDWKSFELHFNNVHENFTSRLLEKYPKLTPQEIKLSAYLRLNLSTKEIAHLLNISVRGVEISRYRLRKKLSLDRNDNLTDFMLKF